MCLFGRSSSTNVVGNGNCVGVFPAHWWCHCICSYFPVTFQEEMVSFLAFLRARVNRTEMQLLSEKEAFLYHCELNKLRMGCRNLSQSEKQTSPFISFPVMPFILTPFFTECWFSTKEKEVFFSEILSINLSWLSQRWTIFREKIFPEREKLKTLFVMHKVITSLF